MTTSSLVDSEVQSHLISYFNEEQSLAEFQEWFARVAWNLGYEGPGQHLVARAVERRLAEYVRGHWSETELRAQLLLLVKGTYGAGGFRPGDRWESHDLVIRAVPQEVEAAQSA